MLGKKVMSAVIVMGATIGLSLPPLAVVATGKTIAKPTKDGREQCYQCHDEVKTLKKFQARRHRCKTVTASWPSIWRARVT